MSNFIINFSRIIVLAALSMPSQASIDMDRYDSETGSDNTDSLKRSRTTDESSSDEDSGLMTPSSVSNKKVARHLDPRIQALYEQYSGFSFKPAAAPARTSVKNPATQSKKPFDKENLSNGVAERVLGAWYKKPETGNWVLRLRDNDYATIIPTGPVELLFGSEAHINWTVFKYPTVLAAQLAAEEMAKSRGFDFSKKQLSSKNKTFAKRKN